MVHPDDLSERDGSVVLIANDQEWTLRSLETVLASEGFRVQRAFTGQQAIDRVRELQPDLLLLDMQLPDLAGPEVCRLLRADPAVGPTLPIVITTAGSNGRSRQLEALEAGAWDFFAQPFDSQSLLLKIRTFVQAKASFERARRASLTDETTELYNLRGLAVRALELRAGATRHSEPFSCVVLAPGPENLRDDPTRVGELAPLMAGLLRRSVRAADAVGRLGPLEFAILAPATDAAGALRIIERIESRLTAIEGGREVVPLRAGLCAASQLETTPVMDPMELLRRAAEALATTSSRQPVRTADSGSSRVAASG